MEEWALSPVPGMLQGATRAPALALCLWDSPSRVDTPLGTAGHSPGRNTARALAGCPAQLLADGRNQHRPRKGWMVSAPRRLLHKQLFVLS